MHTLGNFLHRSNYIINNTFQIFRISAIISPRYWLKICCLTRWIITIFYGVLYMKGLVIKLVAFMGIALFFYSCSDNPTSPTGTGILQVSMTDATANFDTVRIYIDSVQAHIANGDPIKGWYTLSHNTNPKGYDLLALVNGATTIIGYDTLPAGRYSQIRLFIGQGSYVVEHSQPNTPYTLTIPSGVQTGVKLNVDANLQEGFLYNITLDFDAGMSILLSGTPNNPGYTLNPVIRSGAAATTGIISGTVNTSSSIVATSGTDTYTTKTDELGGFKLIYLNPATYTVTITPDDQINYNDATIPNIVVKVGETNDLGSVTLAHK